MFICSDAVPEPVPPHPADDKNEDDAAELYPCSDAIANCQCSKSKVDSRAGMCGGPPGCFYEPGGQEECTKHGDYWLGGLDAEDAAGEDSSDLPHRTARSLRKSPKSLLRGDAK